MGTSQQNINKLFDKLVSSELDFSEKEELRIYIQSRYKDENLEALLQQHWNKTGNKVKEESQFTLDNIKANLIEKINQDDTKVIPRKKKSFSEFRQYALRIAAVLFIPLLIFSAYLYYSLHYRMNDDLVMQEVTSTPGSRVHFVLPDKTEVWLNSESKLEFLTGFRKQEIREVKLRGQAYFKVSHDEAHPFIVNTNSLNIKVLGTSFDVSAYEDDMYFTSTLEEGRVMVMDKTGKGLAILKPGQEISLNNNSRKYNIKKVDTRLTTSWKDGYLIFKDTALPEVAKKLERWYNCKISLSPDVESSMYQFTATINDETLGEVLKMMEISTPIETKIQDREVTIWAK